MTSRRVAVLLALTLTALVTAAIAAVPGRGDTKIVSSYHGRTLAAEGRWLVQHGHVYGECSGCASRRLIAVSYALVDKWFAPHGSYVRAYARCVIDHESSGNPGAVNPVAIAPDSPVPGAGHASGLPQVVVYYHRWVNRWRLLHDPNYAVAVMHRLSAGGRDWSPWAGNYRCP